MRRIPLRYLQENSITAMDIYNPNGKLLISKGLKIDKDMIELLKKNKIIYIYIRLQVTNKVIGSIKYLASP